MNRPTAQHKREAYPAYKPSGVEWLGDVPRHWEVRRLKYTVDLVNMKVDGADNDLPYTGLEHIESWTGKRIAVNGNATSEGQANLYRRGDVLFGKLRPYLAKAHAGESDGICTGELLVLRPRAVAQKFLLDYVLNPDFISVVDSSTYGAKMPRANWNFIGNLPALVPPPDEQRAIGAFLDRETARIDALIEKKRRQIELLQEKRSALISHAVTKGLDPDAKMKDSGIEWLGEIPKHWEVLAFKRLGDFQGGAGFPNDEQGCEDNELPFYKVSDTNLPGNEILMTVQNNAVSRETARKLRAYIFPTETVVFAKVGAALLINKRRILTQPSCIDNNMMGFMRRTCELRWVYFWMCSLDLGELANPGAVPSINEGQIRVIRVPVPPLPEQRTIAAFLDRETAWIDEIVKKVEKSIDLLREHRTALISAAVTGKIDVREELP